MLPSRPHIGILGATGAVGRELLDVMTRHGIAPDQIRLLASPRSAGMTVAYAGASLPVHAVTPASFDGLDVALFSAGGDTSRTYATHAVAAGAVVIDNSSAFRMDSKVPLVVPEINADALRSFDGPGIIANPNCSTIIALMAVAPLHRAAGVERMVVSTYQAASGAGAAMMDELEQQARDHVDGRPYTQAVAGRQYIFNVFSHDSAVGEDGYNEEERKLVRETHKILGDDSIKITATCVRVPVLRAHCEAINLTFAKPFDEADARAVLAGAPGVEIVDDRPGNRFPEPINASGQDDVLVGRIRADPSQPPGRGLDLFVAGDQLRKGAALNAWQILETLLPTRAASR